MERASLNSKDAAEYVGFCRTYLYQLIQEKKIPCYRPSGRGKGKLFFRKEDLDHFLLRNRQAPEYEGAS